MDGVIYSQSNHAAGNCIVCIRYIYDFCCYAHLCAISALGCFHVCSGRLVEQQRLAGAADPADLQVTRVTPLPLSVVLRDPAGHEVTVDAELTSDRRQAVTTALVTGLARATLKVGQGGGSRVGDWVISGSSYCINSCVIDEKYAYVIWQLRQRQLLAYRV